MEIIKHIIEFLFSIALLINALLFVPQSVKIFKNKSARSISLLTFGGFILIQLTTVFHGVINHDYILAIGYLFSIATCSAVVILALIYKNRSKYNYEDISVEQILEQLPGHIYWKNREGVSLGCNTNNWRDYGLKSLSDYIGITDYELFSREEADELRRVDLEVINKERLIVAEEENTEASGNIKLYLSHKIPLRNRHNQIIGILGVSLDITDSRKKEMERLKVLEGIIAEMPGHVFWKNKEGVFLGCNNQQAKTLGLSSWQEVVGKTTYDMVWYDQPEEGRRKQAEMIDENDRFIMETGESQVLEEPLILPDGSEAIYLSKKTPLKNDSGEIIGILGVSFDITEKKKAEQKLLETQHKLEGMTLISAAMAHEMRTPLSAFSIATDNVKVIFPQLKQAYFWAREKGAPIEHIEPFYLDFVEQKLNTMEKEVQSAATFIDIALMNTNPSLDMGYPKVLSISKVIDEALSRYPFTSDQRELVQWQPDSHLDFYIKSDELLITHVLFNLIKNALYYVAKAGKGDIHIWLEPGDPCHKLYFKDTGTGISSHILPRIFDQFFSTTDKSAHPAGVGLTFCKKVMESLKGGIVCESVKDGYTLFILSFPSNI